MKRSKNDIGVFQKWLRWLGAALFAMVLIGCSDNSSDDGFITTRLPVVEIKSVGNTTVVLESDFTAGSYGIIVSGKYHAKSVVDDNATLGFADGNFYILERSLGAARVTSLTKNGEIISQIPLASASFNPHSVCGDGSGNIFVASYEDLTIAVFEKENGNIKFSRSIELPQIAGAKLPSIKFHNGKIYAALQILDETWSPSEKSRILEIDPATGGVSREFESNFMNVQEIKIRGNNLFVIDMGSWFDTDGGITKIDLSSGVKTTILDGKTEGASPQKIEFTSDNQGYLLMYKEWGDAPLARFSLNGTITLNYSGFESLNPVSAISYNETTNTLWVASGTKVFQF